MYTRVLGLTISALILAYGAVGAIAQDRMTQPDQQQMQSHPMGQEDAGTMGHGRMTWRDMMGEHMTGRGRTMPSAFFWRVGHRTDGTSSTVVLK